MSSVLVAYDQPEHFEVVLEERFPEETFVYATSAEAVREALAEHDPEVVFSIKHSGFGAEAHRPLVTHPSVRWVQVGGSGYEHLGEWDPGRVMVSNCAGVLARHLAESVMAGILALNVGLPRYLEQQRRAEWRPHPFPPLSEQTILVVGLGQIGGWVARDAKSLGMRVLAIRRRRDPHPAVDELLGPEALLDALPRADVVSLHLRLDEETRYMMDAEALAAMKPGAILVNTSRGPVVDEAALVECLGARHLRGAYLDVFETEPLPSESPLWAMPNVIITPHASDNVPDWPKRFALYFADNLARWRSGEPLENLVGP